MTFYKPAHYTDEQLGVSTACMLVVGKKKYQTLLDNDVHLPSVRTLERRLQGINCDPGYSQSAMETFHALSVSHNPLHTTYAIDR